MLVQLPHHLIDVQPHGRQALLGQLNEDAFVLHAEQLDLGHILDPQQLLAHVIGKGLQFGVAVALTRQAIDDPVDIPELVVEERPLHPLRQGVAHVTDLLAHGVPEVGHILGARIVPQLEDDLGLPRLGVAADLVGVGHLLQGALDLVGHLLRHLLGRCPRPVGAHHHRTEGERRVLILPQLEIGGPTQQQDHHHQVTRQRDVLQRPARQIEALLVRRRLRRLVLVTHAWLQAQCAASGWRG